MTVTDLLKKLANLPEDAVIRVGGYGSNHSPTMLKKADWFDEGENVYILE